MEAASLLLLSIESKKKLTVYVGMMGSKYVTLQEGEPVQPMANCKRWGLKATPVEAGIYHCCGDVVIRVISPMSGTATGCED